MAKSKNAIFIQIASYRDPQLVPTIKDCLKNAKYPKNLVFSIAWQHSEENKWDNLRELVGQGMLYNNNIMVKNILYS